MNVQVKSSHNNPTVKRHTKRWYQENFGVNPEKFDLPNECVENPHYHNAAYMILWKEEDLEPFKNINGIEQFKKRSEAGRKAAKTRKNNLKNWFTECKQHNPKIANILNRLYQIHNTINELHDLRKECRESRNGNNSDDFWEYEIEHCAKCETWQAKQNKLRHERKQLFKELEKLCGKSKQTIQLARKYIREEMVHDSSKSKGNEGVAA